MSLGQKKELLFLITLVVDNSLEISNISFTPRDLIDMFNLLPNFLQNHL
jgi:hypothetical protein